MFEDCWRAANHSPWSTCSLRKSNFTDSADRPHMYWCWIEDGSSMKTPEGAQRLNALILPIRWYNIRFCIYPIFGILFFNFELIFFELYYFLKTTSTFITVEYTLCYVNFLTGIPNNFSWSCVRGHLIIWLKWVLYRYCKTKCKKPCGCRLCSIKVV